MWVAIAVCIIGAVLIFRDQGSEVPTGIGEYQTVVTARDETTPDSRGPGRISEARQAALRGRGHQRPTTALTPEKPVGETPRQHRERKRPSRRSRKRLRPGPRPRSRPSRHLRHCSSTVGQGDRIWSRPAPSAVPDNADQEAARLQKLGSTPGSRWGTLRTTRSSSGSGSGTSNPAPRPRPSSGKTVTSMPNAIPAHL